MSYYQPLKDAITARDAAERYGLEVSAAGMVRCPFHEDHTPSLKLAQGFHCFGCGAQGDVITFTARLFGITAGEAARKLAQDFEIPLEDQPRGPPTSDPDLKQWIPSAKETLHRYYDLLILWKQELRPRELGDSWHPLFVEALQNQATVLHLTHTLEFGSHNEKKEIYNHYRKLVKAIDRKLHDYDQERDLSEFEKE